MNRRLLGLTIAAGLATFLIVGVAVTELLQSRIEFSLLVGIPAGLIAGAAIAAVVAWGVSEGAPAQRRRLAVAFGTFGATFLVVLVTGAFLPVGTVVSIVIGIGVGLAVAGGTYLRDGGSIPDQPNVSPPN